MAIRHVATLAIVDGRIQVSGPKWEIEFHYRVIGPKEDIERHYPDYPAHERLRYVELEFVSGLKTLPNEILLRLLLLSGIDPQEADRLMHGTGMFDDLRLRWSNLEERQSRWRSTGRRVPRRELRRQSRIMAELLEEWRAMSFLLDSELREALARAPIRRLLKHQEAPVLIGPSEQEWLCGGEMYRATKPYTPQQVQLLVWEKKERERRKFERLRKQMEAAGAIHEARRERIPEDVRTFVWRRDGGRCAMCGRTENLEFDHIIPVSKGGSSSANNVQLLCLECNRKKSNHI